MTLSLHGKVLTNVFRLRGNDENSASFALGWVLEQSPVYRKLVSKTMFGKDFDLSEVEITMQAHGEDGGYTDIEMKAGRQFHAIVEAKRSWGLPLVGQLNRYLPRLVAGGAKQQLLVSVGAANQAYARSRLPRKGGEVEIRHFSWGDLQRLARAARLQATRFEEKLWLHQLAEHLREFASMGRQTDNKVFVVVLNSGPVVDG